jgi:outer membrane receptor protein involved in Fe transport
VPPEGEEVIVTGSNIRGLTQGPSPVQVIDRAAIERDGYGSVADAMAALPQNFGGTGTEDTVLTNTDVSVLNIGLGSSANLRGLGSDATLTLLNGRRLPGSGGKGDFADLSLIPLAAVERVEILTDGASAIYGADAVGGVVNIILRRNLDGGETRLRVGTATQGGGTEVQAAHVQGFRWNGGSLIAAYEYQRRDSLAAADRAFTRSADLRPSGGDDFRSYFSNPGTIVGPSPATGAIVPRFAIPGGTNGIGLTPAQFLPGANLQTLYEGADLLPQQTRHNGYLLVRQAVGSGIELSAQGRYGRRHFSYASAPSSTILTVNAANPFFVSPDGAPSSLIAYWFGDELGPIRNRGTVQSWSVSTGLTADLGRRWALDLYAGYAAEHLRQGSFNLVQSSFLAEAAGSAPDNPATSFSPARDGYFNPYGDGAVNSRGIVDFIDDGYLRQNTNSSLASLDAKLDGPLFTLPGGAVRLAVGASARRERFLYFGETFVAGLVPTPIAPVGGNRAMLAAFGELILPLFGPDNARPGFERLELVGALRYEHYDDFGSAASPKLGLVWEPLRGVRLRASYGTSFRTPALRELNQPVGISSSQLRDAQNVARSVLLLTGGNPDLEPERAQSFTAGLQLAPAAVRGFRAEVNFFRTRFDNRIGTPVAENRQLALRDPTLAPFIQPISPGTNPADRALVVALSNSPGSTVSPLIPPELYTAIVDSRFVNTGQLLVQGIDLLLSQRFALAGGQASVSVNGAFLLDYERRATPAAVPVERLDTVGNPPDLRLRLSTSWDRGPIGLTATINHLGAYRDDLSPVARRVGAWTTVDAQIRLRPAGPGWPDGLQLALSVQNLFDRDPPFVNRSTGQAYDSTNADPLGRYVALQLIKAW